MAAPKMKSESVSIGHAFAGTIESTNGGFSAFGPAGAHVGTFPTLAAARSALFDLHQASHAALLASA